jgi:uncharacterized protein YjiS (DUF1127 family)
MSISAHPFSAASLSPYARFVLALSQIARAIVAFARTLANRGDVRTLLEMDDRCLKDIGLTRGDVIGALAEPLATDPSRILLVRSLERRARQRPVVIARTASGVPAWRV